jgi:hypothetical protein
MSKRSTKANPASKAAVIPPEPFHLDDPMLKAAIPFLNNDRSNAQVEALTQQVETAVNKYRYERSLATTTNAARKQIDEMRIGLEAVRDLVDDLHPTVELFINDRGITGPYGIAGMAPMTRLRDSIDAPIEILRSASKMCSNLKLHNRSPDFHKRHLIHALRDAFDECVSASNRTQKNRRTFVNEIMCGCGAGIVDPDTSTSKFDALLKPETLKQVRSKTTTKKKGT